MLLIWLSNYTEKLPFSSLCIVFILHRSIVSVHVAALYNIHVESYHIVGYASCSYTQHTPNLVSFQQILVVCKAGFLLAMQEFFSLRFTAPSHAHFSVFDLKNEDTHVREC